MSDAPTTPGDSAATGTDSTGKPKPDLTVNVNGHEIGVSHEGQIVAGPPSMKGQYVAPTQFAILQDRKDYHGHLVLSPSSDTAMAETEIELMTMNDRPPELIRAGMQFSWRGLEGRIEDIGADGNPICNLAGVVRPIAASSLIRDAEFHVERTEHAQETEQLTEEELSLIREADGMQESSDNENDLSSKSTDDLLAEIKERLAIVESRKDGES